MIVPPTYSERAYVAPTVFLKAGANMPRWNFYNSLDTARKQYFYALGLSATQPGSAGAVSFTGTAAQTFGINVDFYRNVGVAFYPVSYESIKSNMPQLYVIRFYDTNGAGPYYAVINSKYFGISATVVYPEGEEQKQQLDLFYREVALLKYRYNSLAAFLNQLAKKELNNKEQQIFNEGLLLLQNLSNQIRNIRGIEIYYSQNGTIGIAPILLIAIIAILAGATAWSVSEIFAEKEKTKRINDSYDLQKWVAAKKAEVAANSAISSSDKQSIYKTLDAAASQAQAVAKASLQDDSFLGNIKSIVKWGVVGLLGYHGLKLLQNSKQ